MGPRPAPDAKAGGSLPRLIATDLDGTLLGADRTISPRTAHALAKAAAADAVVVFVTGRSLRTLPRVYACLDARYPAICAHGAVLYEAETDRVRHHQPLLAADVREVCRRLREVAPGTVFAAAVHHGRKLVCEQGWPNRHTMPDRVVTADLDQLASGEPVKLIARAPDIPADSFHQLVDHAVGDIVTASLVGRGGLVEMTRRGVTKATTLAAFAADLGIESSDALAFGDMPGDIPMMRWAGRSVAVDNADPTVRTAADETTLPNTADGVADHLERLFTPDLHRPTQNNAAEFPGRLHDLPLGRTPAYLR